MRTLSGRKAPRVIDKMRSGARGRKLLALVAIACALALRLLVPEGWMPVSDSHGFRITLCTGTGPMEMSMAAMHGMASHHDTSGHGQPAAEHSCPFTHLGLALADPGAPALTPPQLIAARTIDPKPLSVTVGRGLAAPPPPATGPPLLV